MGNYRMLTRELRRERTGEDRRGEDRTGEERTGEKRRLKEKRGGNGKLQMAREKNNHRQQAHARLGGTLVNMRLGHMHMNTSSHTHTHTHTHIHTYIHT